MSTKEIVFIFHQVLRTYVIKYVWNSLRKYHIMNLKLRVSFSNIFLLAIQDIAFRFSVYYHV